MTWKESWVVIEDYPNYAVSDCGRVLNIRRDYLLTPVSRVYDGYLQVCLGRDGRNKLVHRLVAQAFITPDLLNLEVNHLDGNKRNNAVNNLEVVTPSENVMHSYAIGLRSSETRFRPQQVRIVETDEVFPSISSLSRYLSVSPQAVDQAIRRDARVCGVHVERVRS